MAKIRIRRRRPKRRTPREVPVRAIIPNLLTLLSAASGITSIRYSCQGHWEYAVIAILVASVLDGLDGRVARLLNASSKLGAQLDSLSDFVSFGVAPALLIYFWIMQVVQPGSEMYQFRGIFWAITLYYSMCCGFRLARFNTMLDAEPSQPYWKHFFLGLPAPGGAGILLTPIIWQIHTHLDLLQTWWLGCLMLLLCGTMMASRVPTISVKGLRVPANRLAPFLLTVIFLISLLVSQFWMTMGVIGILYLLSIPVCGLWFLRQRRRYESRLNEPAR